MAIKTFTTGEVLTASDTNTYLANAGLVYVTSTTFTTSSQVNVDNCFTSTYDNYLILIKNHGSVAGGFTRWRLRVGGANAAGSDYYRYGYTTTSASAGLTAYNGGAETSWLPNSEYGTTAAESCMTEVSVYNPALAANRTTMTIEVNNSSGASRYSLTGMHAQAVAYDGFSIIPNSGTITGSLTVYGYRKA